MVSLSNRGTGTKKSTGGRSAPGRSGGRCVPEISAGATPDESYFAAVTWPRISPGAFFAVWTFTYHMPVVRSLTCASVRVA